MIAKSNPQDGPLEGELRRLRDHLLLMAGRTEQMISAAVRALVERDPALADQTIDLDALVNRAEMSADEMCLELLAERSPRGGDLRFIALALKMVTDLERIGDLAVNICERAKDLEQAPHLKTMDDLGDMGELVRSQVHDVLDAFATSDVEKAQDVMERDDLLDLTYSRIFRETLDIMMTDSAIVEYGIHIQSAAKWLERIGDHAVNIAEQIIFIREGHDIRHLGKLPGDRR